ncbi:MAG TPA: hypothetical protein VK249_08625 [Anaerolineales bacterium]|nr:hypothetical protein [Anaerolineales bacterium]
MTHSIRTLILRTDSILLALFGLFGMTMDLLGYFAGVGAWKDMFFNNALAVGAVEAHGLAIILAVVLLRHAAIRDNAMWHLTAVTAHLLLGICNLVFWQVFVHVNVVPLGIVATAYHFVFAAANGVALSLALSARRGSLRSTL